MVDHTAEVHEKLQLRDMDVFLTVAGVAQSNSSSRGSLGRRRIGTESLGQWAVSTGFAALRRPLG
eukprot:5900287-Amphidinium_carterae.1